MPGIVLFFLALAALIAESVFLEVFSVQIWALQTPLVIAIYLGLDRQFVAGGLVLTALVFPVEWLVGGIVGVYSLGLAAVFLSLQMIRSNVQQVWGFARGAIAAMAAIAHGLVVLVLLFLLGEGGTRLSATVGWQMWLGALVVAPLTVIVGKGFARLDAMMDPRSGNTELEF